MTPYALQLLRFHAFLTHSISRVLPCMLGELHFGFHVLANLALPYVDAVRTHTVATTRMQFAAAESLLRLPEKTSTALVRSAGCLFLLHAGFATAQCIFTGPLCCKEAILEYHEIA